MKQDNSQIKNLTLYLKKIWRIEITKSKVNKKKEIIKKRAEISETDWKNTIGKVNETMFFEKINKINNTSVTLTKTKERWPAK